MGLGNKIDLAAFIALAITIAAVVYHPSLSKTIAALGGAYTGAMLAA